MRRSPSTARADRRVTCSTRAGSRSSRTRRRSRTSARRWPGSPEVRSPCWVSEATESSWIGGEPHLPAEVPWPNGVHGAMTFVAQPCLADLDPSVWTGPRSGHLHVFCDIEPESGSIEGAGACAILHTPAGADLRVRRFPADLHENNRVARRMVKPCIGLTLPDADAPLMWPLGLGFGGERRAEVESLWKLQQRLHVQQGWRHRAGQLLGWPTWQNNDAVGAPGLAPEAGGTRLDVAVADRRPRRGAVRGAPDGRPGCRPLRPRRGDHRTRLSRRAAESDVSSKPWRSVPARRMLGERTLDSPTCGSLHRRRARSPLHPRGVERLSLDAGEESRGVPPVAGVAVVSGCAHRISTGAPAAATAAPPQCLTNLVANVVAGKPTVLPPAPCNDPDGDALTIVLVDGPAHGVLGAQGADGTRTYTADATYVGTDVVHFKASDGSSESAVSTLTINVLPASAAAPPGGAQGLDPPVPQDVGPASRSRRSSPVRGPWRAGPPERAAGRLRLPQAAAGLPPGRQRRAVHHASQARPLHPCRAGLVAGRPAGGLLERRLEYPVDLEGGRRVGPGAPRHPFHRGQLAGVVARRPLDRLLPRPARQRPARGTVGGTSRRDRRAPHLRVIE